MQSRLKRALSLVALPLALFACALDTGERVRRRPPPADARGPCEAVVDALRRCGNLGPGEGRCLPLTQTSDECQRQCIANESCANINELVCSFDQPFLMGVIADCVSLCSERFICDDGEVMSAGIACDGFAHCDDASDELSCERFDCRDGTTVTPTSRCNGVIDCASGIDESDCPPPFECDFGALLPASARCDGLVQCLDGVDETGCPVVAQPLCLPF